MQRVVVLPKLTTKEHLFVSRPVAFNEIFASKTPDILWHEAIAGRKAPDVASAFLQLIRQCNEHHIWLWTDNCRGQNKKWYLFTDLAQCVNTWTRNYNYQIPRKGSHIHESRCNTWKHQKTISQNKHCCHFWWLCPTMWKGEQQHKNDYSGSTLHISQFQKSTHKIIDQS